MRSCKDDWHDEHYAKQDDIRERYHQEMQDIKNDALIEQEHHEYMNKVHAAGYGDDQDAYESYWSRVLNYFQHQPEQIKQQAL